MSRAFGDVLSPTGSRFNADSPAPSRKSQSQVKQRRVTYGIDDDDCDPIPASALIRSLASPPPQPPAHNQRPPPPPETPPAESSADDDKHHAAAPAPPKNASAANTILSYFGSLIGPAPGTAEEVSEAPREDNSAAAAAALGFLSGAAYNRAMANMSSMRAKYSNRTVECDELQDKIEEMQTSVQEAEYERSRIALEFERSQGELESAMDCITTLREELAIATSDAGDFEEQAAEFKRLWEAEKTASDAITESIGDDLKSQVKINAISKSLSEENSRLHNEKAELERENAELKQSLSSRSILVLDLEEEVKNLKVTVEDLREHCSSNRHALAEASTLKSSLSAMADAVQSKTKLADSLEKELVKYKAKTEVENDLADGDMKILQRKVEKLKSQLDDAVEEKRMVEVQYIEEFSSVETMVDGLRSESVTVQREREAEVAEWSEKCDILAALVEERDQEIEEVKWQAEQALLEKESVLLKSRDEFQSMLQQVESMSDGHGMVLNARDLKIGELEADNDRLRVTVTELQGEMDDLIVAKQNQIADIVAQVNEFETVVKKTADERDQAIVALEVAGKAKADELRVELESEKKAVASLSKELEDYVSLDGMQREEIEILKKEVEEGGVWRLQLAESEARLQESIEMVERTEKDLEASRKHLTLMKEQVDSKEREREGVAKMMELMDAKLKKVTAELQQTRDRREDARAAELRIREQAQSLSLSKKMEGVVDDLQKRNDELESELKLMKESVDNGVLGGGEVRLEQELSEELKLTPTKRTRNSEDRSAVLLSPTFNEDMVKRHDEALIQLGLMKKEVVRELTPVKKKEQRAEATKAVLKKLQSQIELLMTELSEAKSGLVRKDDLINQMRTAVTAYEDDRVQRDEEMQQMDEYVRRAESIVERELVWRRKAESGLVRVQDDIEEMKRGFENKISVIRRACRGVGWMISGAVRIRENKARILAYAWTKMVVAVQAATHCSKLGDLLEAERKLNADMMIANAAAGASSEERVLLLEQENGRLNREVAEMGHNSKQILKSSQDMVVEVLAKYRKGSLASVVRKSRLRGLGVAMRKWIGVTVFCKGYVNGGEMVNKLASQLENTSKKLVVLKTALREGGYSPTTTPMKDKSFCWDISSDEEEEETLALSEEGTH